MGEYKLSYTTLGLVALALALGLGSGSGSGSGSDSGSGLRSGPRSGGAAEGLAGSPRVIDGDTIAIGETRIRLEGIDAPEAAQTCGRQGGGTWACGAAATLALSDRIGGKAVTCLPRGRDRYGRTLAVCFLDGRDINAWMVRQGYAWAFVRYSASYVREETAAKAEGLGIWQGEAVPAWEFRAQRWAMAEPEAPMGCAIKGNVTRNGRIYHMPWSPWYGQIRMAPDRGKRWFCNEAEAISAGWRPVAAR
jgi:endonuclease YncB( thermonuclease family)